MYERCNDADTKGVREFVRKLEAGKEGGDRVSKNDQMGIRTQTGLVACDRCRNRVEGKEDGHKTRAILEGTQRN
jgi:hypothetical protein